MQLNITFFISVHVYVHVCHAAVLPCQPVCVFPRFMHSFMCVLEVSQGSAENDEAMDFTISAAFCCDYWLNILCVVIWAGSVLENPSQQYLV